MNFKRNCFKKRVAYTGPKIVMKVKAANKDIMPNTSIEPIKIRYEKISPEYYIKTLEFEDIAKETGITMSFKSSPVVELDIYQLKLIDFDFAYAINLESLRFHNIDTSSVTKLTQKFSNCSSLTELDLSVLNFSAVINCNMAFMNCRKLTYVNLANVGLATMTNVGYMFRGCTLLNKLDLSGMDTSKVTISTGMFQDCENILEQNVTLNDCSEETKELIYNEIAKAI